MIPSILTTFVVFLVNPVSSASNVDLNPIHQLCFPCVLAANAAKTAVQRPEVKSAEKRTCNNILKNEIVCNGAVEVAGIYLGATQAEQICGVLCGATAVGKNGYGAKGTSKKDSVDDVTKKISDVVGEGLNVAKGLNRFKRQVPIPDINKYVNGVLGSSDLLFGAIEGFGKNSVGKIENGAKGLLTTNLVKRGAVNDVTKKVLDVFDEGLNVVKGFNRFKRQVSFPDLKTYINDVFGDSDVLIKVIDDFGKKFGKALEVYLNGTIPNFH